MTRSSQPSPRWRPPFLRRNRPRSRVRKARSARPHGASVTKRHKASLVTRVTSPVTKCVTPTPFPFPPMIIILTPLPLPPRIILRARSPTPMSPPGRRGGSSTPSLGRIGPKRASGPISSPSASARTWSTPPPRIAACCATWPKRCSARAGRPAGSSWPASSRAGARFTIPKR